MSGNKNLQSTVQQTKTSDSTYTKEQGIDPRIKSLECYHGLISKQDAQEELKKAGDYLVRRVGQMDDDDRKLALCVRWNADVQQFLISVKEDGMQGKKMKVKVWVFDDKTFDSVKEMLSTYQSQALPVGTKGAMLKKAIARPEWQLNNEQIKIYERLGSGQFGDVYRGILLVDHMTTADCAVKLLKSGTKGDTGGFTKKQQQEFLSEARIMRKWNHKNIVRMFGVAVQGDPLMIVLEYCPGGDLLRFLRKNAIKIRLVHRAKFAQDAASGMEFLESQKVIHRDIAARNCLIGKSADVKISDFGLSKGGYTSFKEQKMEKRPIKWLAPEALTMQLYSSKSDAWAFGVLLWEIFNDGAEPYPDMKNDQVKTKVTSEKYRMPAPDGTPEQIGKLMTKCWHENPDKRPAFKEIAKVIKKTCDGLDMSNSGIDI